MKVATGDAENEWVILDNVSYGDEIDFNTVQAPATIEYYLIHVDYNDQLSDNSTTKELALKARDTRNGNVPANRCPATSLGNVGDWFYATDGRKWVKDRGPWEEAQQTAAGDGSGIIARGMNIQGSGRNLIGPTTATRIDIPGWVMGDGNEDFIYRIRKRTDGKFEISFGSSSTGNDILSRLEDEIVLAIRCSRRRCDNSGSARVQR